ncbi:MAG: M28 family peptidase, partial [Thermoleophilaceae bacterium]|nr:M28 family peptidase [Thermoleophilaceae bacterium]
MEAMREIEALVAFEGRIAGSDAERRAAEHLAGRLRSLGREAEVEPISVWPNYALTHMLHALLAVVGSLVSVASPLAGVLIVAFALLSSVGDMTGTLFLVRRLTGRRASQNVVSSEGGDKPGTLVLVAHYDAARAGAIFGRRSVERRAVLAQRLRLPIGLGGVFAIAMLIVLLCTGIRLLGVESLLVSIVQFVPTVLLVLAVPALADVQLSSPVPGAADNASGVAAVLELARRYGGELDHLDLTVLFTGAEESMSLGMREWLRSQ